MIARHHVSGLVLAGGRGRRMQQSGQPVAEKGLLVLHDRPLVAWAVAAMPAGLASIYISANRQHDVYAAHGAVISDDFDLGDDFGPLAGVATAMRKMSTPWLYTAPVDVPWPPADILERLVQQANADDASLVYACTERPQPLFMLVHRRLLSGLEDYLRNGSRQVQGWQQEHGQAVRFADAGHEFFNINTPDDLHRAHQLISEDR